MTSMRSAVSTPLAHARTWCAILVFGALIGSPSVAQTPIHPDGQDGQHPGGTPTGPAGGSYGGPGDTLPSSPPGGPTIQPPAAGGQTPGSSVPVGGIGTGPATAPVPRPATTPPLALLGIGPDPATWEVWWALNRDRFLAIRRVIYAADAASGGPNATPGATGLARRRPDSRFVADRVMPVLAKVLETESDPALLGEALIALARADGGRGIDDAASARAVERLQAALSARQLSVVESAVMALGARGSAHSLPILAALLEDSAAGRAAIGRTSTPTRVRSIAALSLGLAASQARVDAQRYAAHALSRPLQAREGITQDLAAACAAALGLVDLGGPPSSDEDLPAASSSSALVHFLEHVADDSDRDQVVRAQATASVGRVAARADERVRVEAIVWAVRVASDAARPTPVRQAAAIALGRLGRPTGADVDRAARTALVGMQRDTDRLARGLAWLARGEIGARARVDEEKGAALEIQTGLLAEFPDAKTGAQGFLALALGVLAHDSALVAAVDGNRALREALPRARNASDASAIGLASGLRFDITSAALLAERFAHEGDATARAALSLGLGLTGATEVLPILRGATGVENHPLVIRDAAIARALLGDTGAAQEMAALLVGTKSLLAADFASDALSAMGDASVLESLIAVVTDESAGTGRRARAVRALGAAADASLLPWNEPLRADGHVGATFESWNAVVSR